MILNWNELNVLCLIGVTVKLDNVREIAIMKQMDLYLHLFKNTTTKYVLERGENLYLCI